MNNWRDYEKTGDEEKEISRNKVFRYTDDVHNTHSVKPRAINKGIDNSENEPKETKDDLIQTASEQTSYVDDNFSRSDNDGDISYLMTDSQVKLSSVINRIDRPEAIDESISFLLTLTEEDAADKKGGVSNILAKPKIEYADYDYLEKFFVPAVFGVVEDIYNTRHTEFPLMPPHDFKLPEPENNYGVYGTFNQRQPGI